MWNDFAYCNKRSGIKEQDCELKIVSTYSYDVVLKRI